MRNISLKADNVGDTLPAGDFNANMRNELQNAVESADFTLDSEGGPDTNVNMLAQTMADYANAGWFYQDSGSANSYVLSRTTNLKSVQKYFDGMIVAFQVGNTNTGASTINVDTIGSKSLTLQDGTALSAGALLAGVYAIARYNSSDDRFELLHVNATTGLYYDDSGSADDYVLTVTSGFKRHQSYFDGMTVIFKPANTNTGASTVNVDSLGDKDITLQDGTALSAGDIVAENYVVARYDSGNDRFEIVLSNTIVVANYPPNYLTGLTLSIGTDTDHDIDIAEGSFTELSDTDGFTLSSVLTKQIDANWAEGDDAGGFPSGLTLSPNTWYQVFVIAKTDGTVDAGFDTSLSAVNLLADATSYTKYRRIGSVLTDGSQNIIPFIQIRDEFTWSVPVNDYNNNNPGTSALPLPLTTPENINAFAYCSFTITNNTSATSTSALFTDKDITDSAPSLTLCDLYVDGDGNAGASGSIVKHVKTDLSSQIRARLSFSDSNFTLVITTLGWRDLRGK